MTYRRVTPCGGPLPKTAYRWAAETIDQEPGFQPNAVAYLVHQLSVQPVQRVRP